MKEENLKTRIISLKKIQDNQEINFPFRVNMLGFSSFTIDSKEELIGRIKELQDLLNVDLVRR